MNKILFNHNNETLNQETFNPYFSPEFAPELSGENYRNLVARLSLIDFNRWSDAEWVAHSLLDDLAPLRVMTSGQLLRWFLLCRKHIRLSEIKRIITELFRAGLIDAMEAEVPLPQRTRTRRGGNDLQTVQVIFLTVGSKRILENHSHLRFFRFGRPEKQEMERLYHSLLVTESVLQIAEKNTVWGILNEECLKSITSSGGQFAPKSVADFCVFLKTERDIEAFCGEVTVQSDAEQIVRKPENVWFFTPDLRAADLIEAVTGKDPFRLSDVSRPALGDSVVREAKEDAFKQTHSIWQNRLQKIRESAKKSGALNDLQRMILLVIEMYGPLSTEAVALLTSSSRSRTSTALQGLTDRKLLHSEGAQHWPGRQKGCPKLLFGYSDDDLISLKKRAFQLLLSTNIEQYLAEKWRVTAYRAEYRCLTLRHKTPESNEELLLVIDDARLSAPEMADLFRTICRERAGKNAEVRLVPATEERRREMLKS